jgi:hypothetical protein
MARVKVWNDNVHPHTEMFKGEKIHIEPKQYVEMDYEEAVEFKGQFTGMKMRGDGTDCPTGFKMIRIEGKPSIVPVNDLVCHATGEQAATKDDLAKLLAGLSHLRPASASESSDVAGNTNDLLVKALARIEALEAAQAKKPVGRPKLYKKEAAG